MSTRADIERVLTDLERSGRIDVLVNNAGYGYLTAFEEGDEDGYRAQVETNMFGLIAMTKAVLPAMRERRSGRIVNIASVGGLVGNPGSSYYAATKFGVVGLSEARKKSARSVCGSPSWNQGHSAPIGQGGR